MKEKTTKIEQLEHYQVEQTKQTKKLEEYIQTLEEQIIGRQEQYSQQAKEC